jgi:hypothetical protein
MAEHRAYINELRRDTAAVRESILRRYQRVGTPILAKINGVVVKVDPFGYREPGERSCRPDRPRHTQIVQPRTYMDSNPRHR